jgi:hypothetical protein
MSNWKALEVGQGGTPAEEGRPRMDPERMERVRAFPLKAHNHGEPDEGDEFRACVMEAVSYVAGEPWSDAPQCACPVITAFMVSWNDSLPSDADRDRLLKPLIPLIVGTRSTPAVELRRSLMAADWLVRVHTPAWLRAAKLEEQAKLLESLPEITDMAQCPSLMPALLAVKQDAAAARDAAWDAARAAARDAAWDAAWDAARAAARDAAWDAARAAARDAAWDAARAAAWDALKPTVAHLQDSAQDLVRRMCAVTGAAS